MTDVISTTVDPGSTEPVFDRQWAAEVITEALVAIHGWSSIGVHALLVEAGIRDGGPAPDPRGVQNLAGPYPEGTLITASGADGSQYVKVPGGWRWWNGERAEGQVFEPPSLVDSIVRAYYWIRLP